MSVLTDKEAFILDEISKKSRGSQRELAKITGISLGLINVILKRLIKNGYVSISQLNKRKLEYLLTPEGLLESAKKTFHHATNTIRGYRLIESNLSALLRKLHTTGYEYFSIHGNGELRELLESSFYKCLEEAPVTLGNEHQTHPRAVVLNLTTEVVGPGFKGDVVNVLEKL